MVGSTMPSPALELIAIEAEAIQRAEKMGEPKTCGIAVPVELSGEANPSRQQQTANAN